LYAGTNPPSLFTRVENDDFIGKRTSQVSLIVTNGQVFRISVNGYHGAEGFIQLHWNIASLSVNDNFANAANLDTANLWGSVSGNNLGATRETGEPSHAGYPATNSVWFKWTAPQDGEVQMDTLGSSIDTVLGVYTGTRWAHSTRWLQTTIFFTTFPMPGQGQIAQQNLTAQGLSNTNIPPPPGVLLISPTNPPPGPNITFGNLSVFYNQPFTGLPALGVKREWRERSAIYCQGRNDVLLCGGRQNLGPRVLLFKLGIPFGRRLPIRYGES